MADVLTTAQLYMQVSHVAQVAKPTIQTITQDVIPWSYYMYSVIAAVATGLVTGVIGYFVGKRGLTKTQTDLSNVKTAITNVPAEVSKIETEVKTAL